MIALAWMAVAVAALGLAIADTIRAWRTLASP